MRAGPRNCCTCPLPPNLAETWGPILAPTPEQPAMWPWLSPAVTEGSVGTAGNAGSRSSQHNALRSALLCQPPELPPPGTPTTSPLGHCRATQSLVRCSLVLPLFGTSSWLFCAATPCYSNQHQLGKPCSLTCLAQLSPCSHPPSQGPRPVRYILHINPDFFQKVQAFPMACWVVPCEIRNTQNILTPSTTQPIAKSIQ